MIPFIIGAIISFKLIFKTGIGSAKPAGKRGESPSRPAIENGGGEEISESGVGEDFVPEDHKIDAPKKSETKKPAAAAAPPPAAQKPAEQPKMTLPARQSGKGSFDDVLDDPAGVGIDEIEDSNGPEYNMDEEEESE